jgi:hypothetical protein
MHGTTGDHEPRSGPAGLRWLLLLIFPLGHGLTAGRMGAEAIPYMGWHVIAFCACVLLLVRLRSFAPPYWPVWIGLAAFVLGYFVKFYALVSLAAQPSLVITLVVSADRLNLAGTPEIAMAAFRVATLAFCAFCATFFILLRYVEPVRVPYETLSPTRLSGTLRSMTYLAVILLAGTTVLALSLGILNMAEEQERLPFRLGGWVMYSRIALVTTLALAVAQFGLHEKRRHWTAAGLLLLVGLGLTDTLIRTSRGAVLVAGLMVVLIVALVSQKIDRRVIIGFAATFGVVLLLYPIITAYRHLNMLTGGGASLAMLLDAVGTTSGEGSWVGLTAFQMLQRFVGVDMLLFLTEPQTWPGFDGYSAAVARWGTLGKYITHEVMAVPETLVHSEAPSLIGWFLMFGGMAGVLLLFPLFLSLLWYAWLRLWQSNLLVKPVAQVQLLILWLTISSEGTLDGVALHVFAIIASLVLAEMWLRSARRADALPAPRLTEAVAAGPPERPAGFWTELHRRCP